MAVPKTGLFLSAVWAASAAAFLVLPVTCARAEFDQTGSGQASPPDVWDFFRQGHAEAEGGVGLGATSGSNYLLLSLGGGYYIEDGLSLGAMGEAWLGAQPQIYDLSPQVRYVFLDSSRSFKPYLGAFYRRTFFSRDFVPVDSVGARAGMVFPFSPRAYVTVDLAYESYFNCNANSYFACNQLYPELAIVFGF